MTVASLRCDAQALRNSLTFRNPSPGKLASFSGELSNTEKVSVRNAETMRWASAGPMPGRMPEDQVSSSRPCIVVGSSTTRLSACSCSPWRMSIATLPVTRTRVPTPTLGTTPTTAMRPLA